MNFLAMFSSPRPPFYPPPNPPFPDALPLANPVIPSNVYAPQTLPLHSPQPLPPIPQNTFPTPSELLKDLASLEPTTCKQLSFPNPQQSRKRRASKSIYPASPSTVDNLPFGASPSSPLAPSSSSSDTQVSHICTHLNTTVSGNAPISPTGLPLFTTPSRTDTISSHDKKRYYLDSLEQYVLYLHQQLRLVGVEPVPIERVTATRGLSSRSIRTMMVHMQRSTARLQAQKQDAQQQYNDLLAAVQFGSDAESSSPHVPAQQVEHGPGPAMNRRSSFQSGPSMPGSITL